MRTCNTFCIANVGGKCAVQDCRGPVEKIGQKPDFDLELAAIFYTEHENFGRNATDTQQITRIFS